MLTDEEKRTVIRTLLRYNKNIDDVICTCPFVGHYKRNVAAKSWEKSGIEGPLYVCHTTTDDYILIITNQSNHLDFNSILLPSYMYSTQPNYIFWKCKDNQTWGVWFYEDKNRESCWQDICRIMQRRGMTLNEEKSALNPPPEAPPSSSPSANPAVSNSDGGQAILTFLKKKPAENFVSANINSSSASSFQQQPQRQQPQQQPQQLQTALTQPQTQTKGTNITKQFSEYFNMNKPQQQTNGAPLPTASQPLVSSNMSVTPSENNDDGNDQNSKQQEASSRPFSSLVAEELMGMPEFQRLVDQAIGRVIARGGR
eukprot:GDKJ01005635.1.p1 GENE.GDKJ01005635.1~~GDKJ01005635.1.p1  ORF type:complete len:313 (+),score=78.37 GDKJ01005635.1:41-979(+)